MKPNPYLSIQLETSIACLNNLTRRAVSRRGFLVVAFMLGFFAVSQITEAVSPPPDGGYPGGNTAEGQNALLNLTTGGYNTAVGYLSLTSNTTGLLNTAVGAGTLLVNTSDENTATGAAALLSNVTGGQNTANGAFALFSNTSGVRNTASGDRSLYSNISGGYNTAYGAGSLALNAEGISNTAVGFNALNNQVSGDGNTALGIRAGAGVTTASNVICIGADGEDIDDSCYIGNIFGTTSPSGVAVLVNSNGRLGTMTSSKRFKEGIKPMDKASETLFALKPVAFHYKKTIDPTCAPQLGLVAEDVEKVNPDLVIRDKEGKPYTVRYDQVNAMLLNEFLKEHRTVQELKKQMATLSTTVKAQAGQIRKVSARLELTMSPSQTVLNNE
jgi:trimeric autotransporter adhesin